MALKSTAKQPNYLLGATHAQGILRAIACPQLSIINYQLSINLISKILAEL